jgi:DNA-binding response OmpR family regulator
MRLECLVLSSDPTIVETLRPTLEKLSIHCRLAEEAAGGQKLLRTLKFDGVVVDYDDLKDGPTLLADIRKGTSNRTSVAFAILNGTTQTSEALLRGANFVLQKPLSPANVERCFSAAMGFMIRERRRYFRVPVDMPVVVAFRAGAQYRARATNLSEGGLAIQVNHQFPSKDVEKIQFTLPATNNSVETRVELAWADESGHAGLRFINLPQISREHLERWLCVHIEGNSDI